MGDLTEIPGIGPVLGFIGNERTNEANRDMVNATNKLNEAEAKKNREFQQVNADTAHQREIKDLKAAGLNPLLSASSKGADTPSGSMAHFETATATNSLGAAVSSAFEAKRLQNEIKKQTEEIESMKTNRGYTDAQRRKSESENRLIKAQIPREEVKGDLWEVPLKALKKIKAPLMDSLKLNKP